MPEATVNEDDGIVSGQYEIGFAGKRFVVEFVAKAMSMEIFTHEHFGLCVFAFNAAHVEGALFFGMNVGHGYKVRPRMDTDERR